MRDHRKAPPGTATAQPETGDAAVDASTLAGMLKGSPLFRGFSVSERRQLAGSVRAIAERTTRHLNRQMHTRPVAET